MLEVKTLGGRGVNLLNPWSRSGPGHHPEVQGWWPPSIYSTVDNGVFGSSVDEGRHPKFSISGGPKNTDARLAQVGF